MNLLERYSNDTLIRHIGLLRAVVADVRRKRPFGISGWVVLPDHLHCIWTLPPGDQDFPGRWRLIKTLFAKQLPVVEWRTRVRLSRGERAIWQRRYWEHQIRDEHDFRAHMDYLHFNPVKHGYVHRVAEWRYSTFHRLVNEGVYPLDWAGDGVSDMGVGE